MPMYSIGVETPGMAVVTSRSVEVGRVGSTYSIRYAFDNSVFNYSLYVSDIAVS